MPLPLRLAIVALALAALDLAGGGAAHAQGGDDAFRSQIATIQQDQLFTRSRYGRAVQERIEAASRALQEENRRIETDLEAEERLLTQQRQTLAPDAFRKLADAFDSKVEGIRAAQESKSRAMTRQAEEDRQRFFQTAAPILADMMGELGAVALLDKGSVILSLDVIDITDRAVARIDTVLGDGAVPGEAPVVPPAPEVTTGSGAAP
ncbi:OmpH family outer membrane protein [Gemmobacter aquatilis]|nr:OmpH family outer membrane protein [Gemmobacter aquatilis]